MFLCVCCSWCWEVCGFVGAQYSVNLRNARCNNKDHHDRRFGCTILGRQVTQATKFYTTAPNIFSTITVLLSSTHKNVYQFTCTEQKAPDKGDVHGSLTNCASTARNSLHVTILDPKMWKKLLWFCFDMVLYHR
jgi:hypothetical protein